MNEDRPPYEPELLEDTAPEPSEPSMGAAARLLGMFTAPTRVFEAIRVRPTWALVLVMMVLLSVATQAVVRHHLDIEASIIENMERAGQDISDAQLDRIVAQADRWAVVGLAVTGAVIPLIMAAIAAIFLVTLRAAGGETDFRTTFSAWLHATWPAGLVSSALTMILVSRLGKVTQDTMQHLVRSNLAAFLSPDLPRWQLALAGSLDVFSLWVFVLLVLGFSITARISKTRAAVAVLVPWAIYIAGKVALVMILPGS